ncbi:CheR family methyltransferase [Gimesia chilikensis]|uniref:CheR family methyltransferase n=1 Tax=Gimesia chilikensis TaxID=2605989 RepID=UPI001659673C|nr:CheR family methyltransferase [Gimesia chilikensis]
MPENAPLIVVGIGASAGGQEALRGFFSTIDSNPGYAIVLIQHMLPEGADSLLETMDNLSPLPVSLIEQDTRLQPDHVYIVPPHCSAAFNSETVLSVRSVQQGGQGTPVITPSFQSLAEQLQQNSVGIMLSGADDDGTEGLHAIQEAGGITMVQDPESAGHTEMPDHAITAGNADYILQPEQMPAELTNYLSSLNREPQPGSTDLQTQVEKRLPDICNLLLQETDHDFHHYKTGTLVRRIERRIQISRLRDVGQYLAHLKENREEVQALFRELLISVTSFFRDPETFAVLARDYLPQLFENRDPETPIRVWVPGCATGEEAYSLAILLYEVHERTARDVEMHVFATDIDERALQLAREAVYSTTIEAHVSPERLARFFIKDGKHYRVKKEIRDLCVFSTHNLISDPPFSHLDLISCRNLLIYLDTQLQQKLVPVFHFALEKNGYLLLGPSENLMMHAEMFRPLDKKHCISQRKSVPRRTSVLRYTPNRSRIQPDGKGMKREVDIAELPRIAQQILLAEYSPRYAVVNEDANLLTTSAGIEEFLEFPEGSFHNNLIKMTRSGLRSGLRSALSQANKTREKVLVDTLTFKMGEDLRRARLVVHPLSEVYQESALFLVAFEDLGPVMYHSLISERTNADAVVRDGVIEQLETELERTQTELENSIQDLEGSNEELKSSNEELLSINEELQSANEELETSKEELQVSMDTLGRAQADLENLMNGTRIATIFLNRDLQIKSFTPSAQEVYNLNPSDLGRPLTDLTHLARWMPKLPSIESIARNSRPFEDELQLKSGKWLLRRVLPYESEGDFDGMIVTFMDVTEFKLAEIRLETEHAITQLLSDAFSLKKIDTSILETIRKCLQASVGLLWLTNPAQEQLCLETSVVTNNNKYRKFLHSNQEIQFARGEGFPGRTWESMQPEWCEDIHSLVWFNRNEIARKSGLASGIAIPVISDRTCLGVMEFYTTEQLQPDPLLLNMFNSIGHEIGSFISRCRIQNRLHDEIAQKNAVLSSAIDCIMTMDAEGRIQDFNPAAEQTFGYAEKEVVGQSLCDLILPEEVRPRFWEEMQKFLKTGKSELVGRHLELSVLHKSGTEFPVELAISMTQLEKSQHFFTICLRDITLRRQHEAALRDSEGRAQALVEASAHMVWAMTPAARTEEDSPTWRAFTGQTYEEWKGKGWVDAIHPDDRERTLNQWQTAFEKREPLSCEYRLSHRDGGWCWTSVRAVPQLNAEGDVLRWVGMNFDISHQKQLQQELESNEKRLLMALKAGGLAAWEWRPEESFWSDEVYDLLGVPRSTRACPETFFSCVHEDDLPGLQRAWGDAIQGDKHYDTTFRIIRPDGQIRWVAGVGEIIRDQQGNVMQIFGLNWDFTQEREVEETLRKSEQQAKQASIAKSAFLANMSHEIRTPMTSVLGYTDLLIGMEQDQEKASYLQNIKRNGNFLLDIINDILDLSKIEAGKLVICRETFSLLELISDVRAMMRVRASEKNLEFSIEFLSEIPEQLESDPKRLRQILLNLISNAIKFTEQGSVRVVIDYQRGEAEANLSISVIDTGIGMTSKQQARLFQMFSQGDVSVSRNYGGTGLGLAISQRLANMLNGTISVTSQPGEGSTFTCVIQLPPDDHVKLIQPELNLQAPEPVSILDACKLNCRILIVDDQRDVRQLAKLLLQRVEAETEFAEDGLQAVELIEQQLHTESTADLILLDMQMPRMDGYQTVARLREIGYRKPIIALTADAMQGDMKRCLELGCDDYLSKPIDASELLKVVSTYTNL